MESVLNKIVTPQSIASLYAWRGDISQVLKDVKAVKRDRVRNRIPDDVRERILAMALDAPDLSRASATAFGVAPLQLYSSALLSRAPPAPRLGIAKFPHARR